MKICLLIQFRRTWQTIALHIRAWAWEKRHIAGLFRGFSPFISSRCNLHSIYRAPRTMSIRSRKSNLVHLAKRKANSTAFFAFSYIWLARNLFGKQCPNESGPEDGHLCRLFWLPFFVAGEWCWTVCKKYYRRIWLKVTFWLWKGSYGSQKRNRIDSLLDGCRKLAGGWSSNNSLCAHHFSRNNVSNYVRDAIFPILRRFGVGANTRHHPPYARRATHSGDWMPSAPRQSEENG